MSQSKTKLETIYLMSIIPHFISLNMLMRFHQVSRKCGEAIDRLKINPCYQELSLETILQNDHSTQIKKEIQIFTGIETLHTSIETLEHIPLELVEHVHLFEISFVQRQNPTTSPIWNAIKERISRLEITVPALQSINLVELKNLRRLEIKAGRHMLSNKLPIWSMENIRVIVIECDGNLYKQYYDLFESFVSGKLRVMYKLNWLTTEDLEDIKTLKPRYPPTIYLNELPSEIASFMTSNIIFLYQHKKEFRIPIDVFLSQNFMQILMWYFPSKLDVRGDIRNSESCIIDIHDMISMDEIVFNFVTCTQKISLILPLQLKKLELNDCDFIQPGGLLQIFKTQIPKESLYTFGSLLPLQ